MDPTHADVAYGENERHRVDLYLADSGQPTPLYLHIHGGGFRRGDKSGVGQCLVNGLAESGISIASMNYRFSGTNPFPASFEDGVRAIQFLRYKADEYNLDRERFAAGGGSAGGGLTFYVGYKPDRSDPNSTDPVCRESSLLQCIAANDTQSSYDCNYIKTIISGLAYRNTALLELFQVTTDEFDTDRAIEQFYSSSALNHVTTDAPPTCVSFFRFDLQMTDNLSSGDGIHHPIFGRVLKERMDELGVRCDIYFQEDLGDMDEGEAKAALADKRMIFLREHLL